MSGDDDPLESLQGDRGQSGTRARVSPEGGPNSPLLRPSNPTMGPFEAYEEGGFHQPILVPSIRLICRIAEPSKGANLGHDKSA